MKHLSFFCLFCALFCLAALPAMAADAAPAAPAVAPAAEAQQTTNPALMTEDELTIYLGKLSPAEVAAFLANAINSGNRAFAARAVNATNRVMGSADAAKKGQLVNAIQGAVPNANVSPAGITVNPAKPSASTGNPVGIFAGKTNLEEKHRLPIGGITDKRGGGSEPMSRGSSKR